MSTLCFCYCYFKILWLKAKSDLVGRERLFMHRSSALSGFGQFVHPFSNLLWCGVIAVTTFSALLMGFYFTVARRCGLEKLHSPLVAIRESFLVIFSSLLQQGIKHNTHNKKTQNWILFYPRAQGLTS